MLRNIINQNLTEVERCSKKGFIPKTENEKIFSIIKLISMKLVIYNKLYNSSYGDISQELESAAFYGLYKAIKTYNEDRNTKFSTYAMTCVENEMKMAVNSLKRHQNAKEYSLDQPIRQDDKDGAELNMKDVIPLKEENILEKTTEDDLNKVLHYACYNTKIKQQRMILYLLCGYSQSKIAEIFNVGQTCISVTIKRVFSNKLKNRSTKTLDKKPFVDMDIYIEENYIYLELSNKLKEDAKNLIDDKQIYINTDKKIIYRFIYDKSAYEIAQELLIILEKKAS